MIVYYLIRLLLVNTVGRRYECVSVYVCVCVCVCARAQAYVHVCMHVCVISFVLLVF